MSATPQGTQSVNNAAAPEKLSVKNVSGSTAGAGSGDFHHYRSLRRKEMFRLQRMEREAAIQETKQAFENKLKQNEEEAEARTAKKRGKRQKANDRKKQLKEREKRKREEELKKEKEEKKAEEEAATPTAKGEKEEPEAKKQKTEETQEGK